MPSAATRASAFAVTDRVPPWTANCAVTPRGVVIEGHETVSGLQVGRPEPRPRRVQQDLQQLPAAKRYLWPLIARRAAARLVPYALAMFVEIDQLACRHAAPQQLIFKPEVAEHAHGVRQQVDANPERADFGCHLIDERVMAPCLQDEAGGQAAYSRSGDKHSHTTPP